MAWCSPSTNEPTDRSLLLHPVQNQYTKAISFALMIEMRDRFEGENLVSKPKEGVGSRDVATARMRSYHFRGFLARWV